MSLGSVLILDDNRAQAQHVSRMLYQQKWTSVLSFEPAMALKMMKSSRFHLLLFEAYVDGTSTMQIVDQIKGQAENTPLAIMSDGGYGGKALKATMDAAKQSGADFTLSKPFSPDNLKTLLADTNSYHRARRTEETILVVEDDPYLRKDICDVLKQVGYTVAGAGNMEDAFFDHNLGMIDVVLTSILIPGIGGVEGTAQIKRDWPHVQVIAMSQGVNDTITALHVLSAAKAAGADALLPKPFTMPEMLRVVASVIKSKDADPADAVPDAAQAAIDAIFAR